MKKQAVSLDAKLSLYKKTFGELEDWLECIGDECSELSRNRQDGLCEKCVIAAKDAEIARLRAERDAFLRNAGLLSITKG